MLRNFIKSAWRNLMRQKLSSAINLFGLVVSMASCLLIMLYVQQELSYDDYHQNANRISRLTTRITFDGKEEHAVWVPNFIGEQLQADYPEVERIIRLQPNPGKMPFRVASKADARPATETAPLIGLEDVYTVYDPAYLQVFTYPLLAGNPRTALLRPNSVVITESVARKLFGSDESVATKAVGKVLQSGGITYQITGVLRDLPANTDRPFQVLIAQDAAKLEKQAGCLLFVLFTNAAAADHFQPRLAQIAEKIQADFAKRGGHIAFALENLRKIHLSDPKSFDTPKANRSYLIIFSLVAGFLLLIASINYVNLSLAQSFGRSREVGVRKALGATRLQLLGQFLGESLLLTGLALILSLLLVAMLLPVYNGIADTHFSFYSLFTWSTVRLLLSFFGIVGVAAGSYPALYLASFEPVKALKGKLRLVGQSAKGMLGQGLVVVQFTIAIAIIIGTLFVYKQLRYLQQKPLGFQREQVLVLDIPQAVAERGAASTLKAALSGSGYSWVAALSGSGSLPSQEMNLSAFNLEKGGQMLPLPQRVIDIDENYLAVLGIPLVAGRNFTTSAQRGGTTGAPVDEVLVNEALVAKMGWGTSPEAALGKKLSQGPPDAVTWRGQVVGVIRDFHFQSPQKPIEPMVLQNKAGQFPEKMLIRLPAGQWQDPVKRIEQAWRTIVPDQPFEFAFLDATFDKQYRQEQRLITIFTYFSVLTIIVACLGLYGLSAFATAQRTREVGVRKVMGAQEPGLLYLLSKDYLRLVGMAILLASPLAGYATNRWLHQFAYHTSISPGEFILADGAALLIAALTTGYHALRLARTNPVRALRHE